MEEHNEQCVSGPETETPAALLERLKKRYPSGHPLEKNMAMLLLRNRDMPLLRTAEDIKNQFGLTLRQWLEQNGLLEKPAVIIPPEPEEKVQPEEPAKPAEPEPVPEPVVTAEPETVPIPAEPEPMSTPASVPAPKPEPKPEPVKELTAEQLNAAVQTDTQAYERMLCAKNQPYSVDNIYVFLRMLRRGDEDRWLRRTQGISYDEYLLRNGIVPQRNLLWWQARGEKTGKFSVSGRMASIRVPVYDGAKRVPQESLRARILERPELRAVYREDCRMPDVQVLSAGEILGSLNRTLFRSTGIGTALAPMLMLRPDCVSNPRLSDDGCIEFELRLQESAAAGKEND